MNFKGVLDGVFPGARPEKGFVEATQRVLQPLGFTRKSALACTATCRDEISQSWVEAVQACWGPSFNFASLAGMVFAGKTGLGAALSHAPDPDGRARYVFYAGPHVGIGAGGEPGVCERESRRGLSTACGALLGLMRELEGGQCGAVDDPDDVEQGLIRQRIGGRCQGKAGDLFQLTGLAHDVIREDLERLLSAAIDTGKSDYALITGIQIHGPAMTNYIQPRTLQATVRGERVAIDLPDEVSA